MTTMIEKVALAIAEDVNAPLPMGIEDTRYAAIAAIKVLREPTKEMLDAGNEAVDYREYGENFEVLGDETLIIHWRAMIDAALKEGQ